MKNTCQTGVNKGGIMIVLGIDIGGSATKGALVDTETGKLVSERIRHKSDKTKKPKEIVKDIRNIAKELNYSGIIGAGFPGIVKNGVIGTSVNLHKDWVGANLAKMIEDQMGHKAFVLNDADSAGLAEMRFGTEEAQKASVIMFLTIGTGIGTALFVEGKLLQNTELGHMSLGKYTVEEHSSAAVKSREKLTWKQWAVRFNEGLKAYEFLLSPDLFILGGGISSRFEKYSKYLTVETKVIPAKLENLAGIIGAAVAAQEKLI
jgi:polyphosphate glucokinase